MKSLDCLDWRGTEPAGSLIEIFENRVNQHPNRLFIADMSIRLTWGEVAQALRGFASTYGEQLRDKDVAMFMGNGAPFFITYLSVLFCGGRVALLNAAMPRKSGALLMESLTPEMVFADHPLEFKPDAIVVDNAMIAGWVASDAEAQSACGTGHTPATYLFSGGTTGIPKRILYSHRKLVSAGARMQWGWPTREADVFLPIAPYSHIYGFLAGICLPLQSGGSSIVPERFHPAGVLDLIERERVSVLGGGPPAVYQALMSDPDLDQRDLSSLRVCPGGGAAFPVEVHRRWEKLTGLTIYEGYGMTEVAPITANTDSRGSRLGAAGKPVPDTEVDIVDLQTGSRSLPRGEAGEIRVRGPHVMPGYCDNPEETALVLRDGWVHTGDIGVIDEEGFLTITDRKKDVIIHKGFNVFPREVEEAVMSHPDVAGVCVVGVPDARSGEVVVAYVVLRAGAQVDAEMLCESCRQFLVPYKLPGRIEFLGALPLTPAGKVDRMALRARARGARESENA
ncbi:MULTISPECIES: class I adenylate-forming enzyme family protein [Actibacterium]|uniref:Long-chain acyl-CoA synthetase n=1 Tax=Actibacterium naphthalenivorans TaxID=1614693 RepID=A0A840CFK2_9RHOB|nr:MULTISPECIES: AMP-binding protein [Actibacterium]ALG91455.1 long-chain fatty acid--CoA ligase [Actibacterium sp. EMB200-NS6]MBB4022892.1 long-chain acyl-CoA synthetase [Actibacterium naphthalenivorans]